MLNVPVPVRLNWHPAPPRVSAPEMVAVPVVIFRISGRAVVVADIMSVPQLNVPAFTFVVQVCPVEGRGIVNALVMARELLPLMVTALEVVTAAKVSERHCAAMSTVTVIPELMVTASEEVGTDAPPHVVVELQLPETEAVLLAPQTVGVTQSSNTTKIGITHKDFVFISWIVRLFISNSPAKKEYAPKTDYFSRIIL